MNKEKMILDKIAESARLLADAGLWENQVEVALNSIYKKYGVPIQYKYWSDAEEIVDHMATGNANRIMVAYDGVIAIAQVISRGKPISAMEKFVCACIDRQIPESHIDDSYLYDDNRGNAIHFGVACV